MENCSLCPAHIAKWKGDRGVTEERFTLSREVQIILFLFMGIGFSLLLFSYFRDPTQAWANILLNNFYLLTFALSGTFFISIQAVSNASWATGMKRIPEAMTAYLPVAAAIMLLLYFGMHSIYHWTHHEAVISDEILRQKSPYLNIPFFIVRILIVFGIWIFFSKKLIQNSRRQDVEGGIEFTSQNLKYSAIFLVLFALTFTIASYDWMMSLEPHWYSTIFSVYTFAGLFSRGVVMITLIVLILLSSGYLKGIINENHLHDLGKLIFAFSTFWAYCWFCQYMLIWYANLPEETAYFLHRQEGGWFPLFILNLILNWIVPFLVLMPRATKRNQMVLWIVAIVMLFSHWLDIYLMVFPSTVKKVTLGFTEIFSGLGFLALFFWVVFKALEKAPLVPLKDPYLEESLQHRQ